ncbi:MAG: histidine--tRNA ligase [Candidatus Tectomicrobia bacterium]|uniref:Histidine--tRNA ligase n=1 Tax=Tectimicrobiota bacterium TaxID=2528274 RepID=A0A933GJH7_UNCTE|nr:histidine--tRNA ligase [Candidatus Tectomicrobia bacterium]
METGGPRILKGTRDFLPHEMLRREYVIQKIKDVFESHGFEPLATPAIEYVDILTKKYGEEVDKLIYKLSYRDGNTIALRYDLTVPTCRVAAMHQNAIVKPFKRYQIQPVWRAEKPQKGRLREFYQCDVDILGSSAMLADAEIISIIYQVLTALGFKNFKIRINNRKILNALIEFSDSPEGMGMEIIRSIDKWDKIGREGVQKELEKLHLAPEVIGRVFQLITLEGSNDELIGKIGGYLSSSAQGKEGLEELQQLFDRLPHFGIPPQVYTLDLCLARGLDYYTGPIYETVVEQPRIGSLTGGGRYDHLVKDLSGIDLPATGTTIGLERILVVMDELGMFPLPKTMTQAFVAVFSAELIQQGLETATMLRKAGIRTEIFYESARISKQLEYAQRKGIPWVVILGPDEIALGQVSLKNMDSGQQQRITLPEAVKIIKNG